MSNTFTIEEMNQRLEALNAQLEDKKKAANRILIEVENICREMLSIQEMIKSKQNGGGPDNTQ